MSDYCLVCFTEIVQPIGWNSLIGKVKKQTICDSCTEKLEEVGGETCEICDRPMSQLEPKFIHGQKCFDCVLWEDDPTWKGSLSKNQSLFLYNDFLQKII